MDSEPKTASTPVSKPRPEKPARCALSLPDTANGDTLLVLPEERDVPPAILNERTLGDLVCQVGRGQEKI